jgi:hypothetical protein
MGEILQSIGNKPKPKKSLDALLSPPSSPVIAKTLPGKRLDITESQKKSLVKRGPAKTVDLTDADRKRLSKRLPAQLSKEEAVKLNKLLIEKFGSGLD